MPKNKKKTQKKGWRWLGWLAGFFGLAILLLTVVLVNQKTGKEVEIFQVTYNEMTPLKVWNFSTPEQVGENGWQGQQSDTDAKYRFNLTVVNGKAEVKPSNVFLGSSAILFNNAQINVPPKSNQLRVVVAMKAEFQSRVPGAVVSENTAGLNLVIFDGQKISEWKKSDQQKLTNGEAVYVFDFNTQAKQGFNIRRIEFQPTTSGQIFLKNMKIDRIRVASEAKERPRPAVATSCNGNASVAQVSWPEAGQGDEGYTIDVNNSNNWNDSDGFWHKHVLAPKTLKTNLPQGFTLATGTAAMPALTSGNKYYVRVYYRGGEDYSDTIDFIAKICP